LSIIIKIQKNLNLCGLSSKLIPPVKRFNRKLNQYRIKNNKKKFLKCKSKATGIERIISKNNMSIKIQTNKLKIKESIQDNSALIRRIIKIKNGKMIKTKIINFIKKEVQIIMERNLIDKRDNTTTTINRNKIQRKFMKIKIMKMEINIILNQLKVKKSILLKMTPKKI
jgi:hypothetical protein